MHIERERERELVKMMKCMFVNHDIMGMSLGFNILCHMSYVFIYIYYIICIYICIYILYCNINSVIVCYCYHYYTQYVI